MNTFRTVSRLVVMTAVVFGGSVGAKSGYVKQGFDFCWNNSPEKKDVGEFFVRNYITGEINKKFKIEHPLAKVGAQSGLRMATQCILGNEKGLAIDSLCNIAKEEAPHFATNLGLRLAVKAGANYGYNVKNIVPEKAKNLIELAPEMTEDSAYELATAAIIGGAPYVKAVMIAAISYFYPGENK